MINVLRAETRKILTVQAAYLVAAITVALIGTISVANLMQLRATDAIASDAIQQTLFAGVAIAGQIAAVFAIILLGHEYRYNLIFHTLTSTKSRSAVLTAKILTSLVYALFVTALSIAVAYLVSSVTLGIIVESAPTQNIEWLDLTLKGLVYVAAFTLIGLLLTLFFRAIVMPIVIIILVPSTLEPLLGLLLDDNSKYLPFASIQELVIPGVESDLLRSTITITAYLIIGWAIGWYLFMKRDATQQ